MYMTYKIGTQPPTSYMILLSLVYVVSVGVPRVPVDEGYDLTRVWVTGHDPVDMMATTLTSQG